MASETCHSIEQGRPLRIPTRIGTCAWSFDEWHGVFYPAHLPTAERLAYYAQTFGSVEIDSTFYAPPNSVTARHWCEVTPKDFVFSCKLPRALTHDRKLRDCRDLLLEFLHAIAPLQPKLGAVLLQMPPYFKLRNGDESALREFLPLLPREMRFAVEFRDIHWHVPRIARLLEEYRVAWVWNDITPLAHQNEAPFDFAPVTTDFLYMRLLGDLGTKYAGSGERLFKYTKLMWPRDGALESWAVKIRQHEADVARALIYANNHYEGFSPATCERVARLLGVEIGLPELTPPAEPRPSAQLELGF